LGDIILVGLTPHLSTSQLMYSTNIRDEDFGPSLLGVLGVVCVATLESTPVNIVNFVGSFTRIVFNKTRVQKNAI